MGAAETNGGENSGHQHILFLIPAPDDDQLIGPYVYYLGQCFSNFNLPVNYLNITLLKYRLWFIRSGEESEIVPF